MYEINRTHTNINPTFKDFYNTSNSDFERLDAIFCVICQFEKIREQRIFKIAKGCHTMFSTQHCISCKPEAIDVTL